MNINKYIGEGISGAVFSEDRQYRYVLWRVWNRERPAMIFVGLNPSYANEVKDDATVSKLAWHAKMLKYGGLYVGNLFAIVNPYSERLVYGNNAVGEENDKSIIELKRVAGIIVVGWGNHGCSIGRDKVVLNLLGKPVYCFAVTKRGMPTHPLYIRCGTELKEYLSSPIFK